MNFQEAKTNFKYTCAGCSRVFKTRAVVLNSSTEGDAWSMGMKVITVMRINIALVTVKIKGRLDAGGSDRYYGIVTVVRDRLKTEMVVIP